jgi:hypothetical protein
MLDTSKKRYMDMSETMQSAHNSMANAMNDPAVQEKLRNLPPEQRARIEQMMQQRPGAVSGASARPGAAAPHERHLEFTKTGETKTVGGFHCEMYHITDGGRPYEDDCIAPYGSSTVTKDDMRAFLKMAEAMRDMMGAHAQSVGDFGRYPGFPVQRTRTMPDGRTRVETIKSIKHGKVSSDLFVLPAGYSKQTLGRP